ncbi:MAG TPA: EamA family transporter [Arenibaculum sp.]|nr:EamA family transporter [Arenibaculum sp.]
MRAADVLKTLAVMVIWGFNFVVIKVALNEFSPLFVTFLRFTLVSVLLVPFVRMPRGKFGHVFVFSVLLGAIHFPMMFFGLTGVDAATASVAIQLQVPFAALLAALVFKDRLGWRRAAGMVVAFAGIVVIAGEPRMSASLGPLLLVIGASFVFAVANVHVKRMGDIDGFVLNGWMALFTMPQLFVLTLAVEDGHWEQIANATWLGWGALIYMAVLVTIVAYGAWYPLLRRYDVNQTMPWTLTVPVFGVASGVLVLGDPLTPTLVTGGLLTIAGVAIILTGRPRARAAHAGSPV